ncbi:MAG: NfeD family protein [Muribaculaceae bacterium]|nr:NfeD family protein [Muribaculaceae bacterium]
MTITWILWLIIAAVLVIVEILSQMVWTLCLAIACVAALVACLMGCTLPVQLAVLAVASVVAYLVLVPYFKKIHHQATEREGRSARTGMDALIGMEATVVQAIEPGRLGRVKVDGDNWQARARHEGESFMIGQRVRIHSYYSIILTVESIK